MTTLARPCRYLPLALAILTTSAAPASAQELRPPGAHWSLTIPDGWQQMDQAALDSLNAAAQAHAGVRASDYIAGLTLIEDPAVYALLQPHADARIQGMDYDSLERAFGAETFERAESEVDQSIGDLVTDFDIGTPTLDRERARIILMLDMTGAEGTRLKGITQSLLWAGGALNVHAYAPADSFETRLPQLLTVADAVRFDPGHQFTPGQPRGFSWAKVLQTAAVCTVLGAILGALSALFRRKNASPPLAR